MKNPLLSPRRLLKTRNGVALIIVLAFVVLVTGIVVAFFARAMTDSQIAGNSAQQNKLEILSQGAMDTIVGDLRQEIAAGSTATNVGPTGKTSPVFAPTSNQTVVPFRVIAAVPAASPGSSPSPTPNLPNLVKRSAYDYTNNQPLPFYTGVNYNTGGYPPSSRACDAPTTTASLNGRSISLARWNYPLLLPKQTPGSATDYTPLNSGNDAFPAPDWILVSRDGTNPTTFTPVANAYTNILINPAPTNSKFVVGRYAARHECRRLPDGDEKHPDEFNSKGRTPVRRSHTVARFNRKGGADSSAGGYAHQ
jgi:hypothetical protein